MLRPEESVESEQALIECSSPHLATPSPTHQDSQTTTTAGIVPHASQPAADERTSQTSPALFAPRSPTPIAPPAIRFSPLAIHCDVTALSLPQKRSRNEAWQNMYQSLSEDQPSPQHEPISSIEPNDDQRSLVFSPLNHQDHARYINLFYKRPRFK